MSVLEDAELLFITHFGDPARYCFESTTPLHELLSTGSMPPAGAVPWHAGCTLLPWQGVDQGRGCLAV